MAKKDKFTIWSDCVLNLKDWEQEIKKWYGDEELTEEEMYDLMIDLNRENLDDERMNLNIQLSQPIIAIADLGLWNGRRMGYKEIRSGNIADCLYTECDYAEWYVDERGDLCMTGHHHDGTNHVIYRVFKDEATETQRVNLMEKIYSGKATRKDITRVTRRLGDEIEKVYGWKL